MTTRAMDVPAPASVSTPGLGPVLGPVLSPVLAPMLDWSQRRF